MAAEAARSRADWAMQACCLRSCCSSAGAAAGGSPPLWVENRRRRCRWVHSPRCRLQEGCLAHARCRSCRCWRCCTRWRASRHAAGRHHPCCCRPPRHARSLPGRLSSTTSPSVRCDQTSIQPNCRQTYSSILRAFAMVLRRDAQTSEGCSTCAGGRADAQVPPQELEALVVLQRRRHRHLSVHVLCIGSSGVDGKAPLSPVELCVLMLQDRAPPQKTA